MNSTSFIFAQYGQNGVELGWALGAMLYEADLVPWMKSKSLLYASRNVRVFFVFVCVCVSLRCRARNCLPFVRCLACGSICLRKYLFVI